MGVFLRYALVLIIPAACNQVSTPPFHPDEMPERQFILEGLHLEERRDGRVLWTGTGKRADGDLSVSDVTDLVLVRKPQDPNETEFTLRAPRGHLAFDTGNALFEHVRVQEPGGGVLLAERATYDEKQGVLLGEGPVHFSTTSMVAHASGAVVSLREGTVQVQGPVEGRLDAVGRAAPAPQAVPPP